MTHHQSVTVRYAPGLDVLYIWYLPKKLSTVVPIDAGYFFIYQAHDDGTVCGYEWIDFSYFVNEDESVELPIEEPAVLFDVEGTDVRDASLTELVRWAHQRFVGVQSAVQADTLSASLR